MKDVVVMHQLHQIKSGVLELLYVLGSPVFYFGGNCVYQ